MFPDGVFSGPPPSFRLGFQLKAESQKLTADRLRP
jgi:hypothetical protein